MHHKDPSRARDALANILVQYHGATLPLAWLLDKRLAVLLPYVVDGKPAWQELPQTPANADAFERSDRLRDTLLTENTNP